MILFILLLLALPIARNGESLATKPLFSSDPIIRYIITKYNHGEACKLGLAPRVTVSCLVSPSRHIVRVTVLPTSVDASK